MPLINKSGMAVQSTKCAPRACARRRLCDYVDTPAGREPLATLGLRGAGLARLGLEGFVLPDSRATVDRDRILRAWSVLSAADLVSIAHGMTDQRRERLVRLVADEDLELVDHAMRRRQVLEERVVVVRRSGSGGLQADGRRTQRQHADLGRSKPAEGSAQRGVRTGGCGRRIQVVPAQIDHAQAQSLAVEHDWFAAELRHHGDGEVATQDTERGVALPRLLCGRTVVVHLVEHLHHALMLPGQLRGHPQAPHRRTRGR